MVVADCSRTEVGYTTFLAKALLSMYLRQFEVKKIRVAAAALEEICEVSPKIYASARIAYR